MENWLTTRAGRATLAGIGAAIVLTAITLLAVQGDDEDRVATGASTSSTSETTTSTTSTTTTSTTTPPPTDAPTTVAPPPPATAAAPRPATTARPAPTTSTTRDTGRPPKDPPPPSSSGPAMTIERQGDWWWASGPGCTASDEVAKAWVFRPSGGVYASSTPDKPWRLMVGNHANGEKGTHTVRAACYRGSTETLRYADATFTIT